ncbi:MAG: hypothetical protein M1839_006602 [Geoglossum umbratile]|nr:MAG: hypothetical protein M1839_006602 [Geoglossum umbratile]
MDIKTLLNPPSEDSGCGLANGGESMAWDRHGKVDRQIYGYGTEELGKRSANDLLHRRAREVTSTRQGSLHLHSSHHTEVFDRDGDESTYASTHKSSISRSSFSSFTSTSPSVSGTSSSLFPEQDRSFPSPPLPPHANLQSRALHPTENRLLPSVDAVGFTTTSYMARSPPQITPRASFPIADFQESTYPLSSASQPPPSSLNYGRYIPSSVMAAAESTWAAPISIATAGDWETSSDRSRRQTQGRQACDSANVSPAISDLQSYAEPPEPPRRNPTNISNNVKSPSASGLNLNAHSRLEGTDEIKDDCALDRAGKSGSGTPGSATPNYGHGQQLYNGNVSQADSISSGSSTPPHRSRTRAKPRNRSPRAAKADRRRPESRSTNETERPALASLSPMQSSQSEGSPVDRPLELMTNVAVSEAHSPRCSYTDNCTTGSPLRKVVSHIFGRNKLCTRQIPKSVWVHYCRKHYQRSRYRNPRGFALLQCDLVRKQVDRLQIWGGVTDWVIKVRKREELRLSREKAEREAGVFVGEHDNLAPSATADTDDPILSKGRKHGSAGSGVSMKWLLNLTGPEKTTVDVLSVLERIEKDIADTGASFPDVEILPNVGQTTKAKSSGISSPRRGSRPRAGSQKAHDLHSEIACPDSSCNEASSDPETENLPGDGSAKQSFGTSQGTLKRKRKTSGDVLLQGDGPPAARGHDEQRLTAKRRRTRTDL